MVEIHSWFEVSVAVLSAMYWYPPSTVNLTTLLFTNRSRLSLAKIEALNVALSTLAYKSDCVNF